MYYHVSKKIMLAITAELLQLAGVDDDIIENRADEYLDVLARDWGINEDEEDANYEEYYIINSNDYE